MLAALPCSDFLSNSECAAQVLSYIEQLCPCKRVDTLCDGENICCGEFICEESVCVGKKLFTCRKYTFFLHSDPNTTEMPLIPGFGGNLGFQHFILWPASFSAGYETNVTEGHEIYNILFWALAIAFASCLVNFFRSFRVLAHGSFVAHFLDLISPVPFLIFTILLTELIFKVVFSTKELLKADTVFSFSWIYVLGVGRAKK